MNISKGYLIISAERYDLDVIDNIRRTTSLRMSLGVQGVPHTHCEGVFEGKMEASFMIPWSQDNEDLVQGIAAEYTQDCYLVIDSSRYGYLYEPGGKYMSSLGRYATSATTPNRDYTKIGNKYMTFPEVI